MSEGFSRLKSSGSGVIFLQQAINNFNQEYIHIVKLFITTTNETNLQLCCTAVHILTL